MRAEPEDEPPHGIRAAEVVLPCRELQPTIDFFVQRLGFRLDHIAPADDPRRALVTGHGVRLRLERGASEPAGRLRIACDDPGILGDEALVAPNGTRIELVAGVDEPGIPAGRQEWVVSRAASAGDWITGRAGMRYRDLIPGRLGGRFIASHIRIEVGGKVPDRVHFHAIRFQMIHCLRGWVRVVYEDQGPPFELHAGDAVLQPPRIRHRVLECSPGLEVVELACPAEHDTFLDHALALPTDRLRPERDFRGQRFVRHEGERAAWRPSELAGFECRDHGLAEATNGLASAGVLRPTSVPVRDADLRHDGELRFVFVLAGEASVERDDGESLELARDDALVVPAGTRARLESSSPALQLLEVGLPARA